MLVTIEQQQSWPAKRERQTSAVSVAMIAATRAFVAAGFFPSSGRLGSGSERSPDPELSFGGRSCHPFAVLGWIEPVTRRAAGDVAGPISRPSAHSEPMADRPEHQRKKVVRHRHVKVTP